MKPGKVVIVEDSPTASAVLRQLVEDAGFEVVGMADNGVTGEELIRIQKPTLVLSDIRMPQADGIEMTARVMRSHPVPIVLITAYDPTSPQLVFRAMKAGALEVLGKPPSRQDPSFDSYRARFVNTLKVLSGLPVVKRIEPTNPKGRTNSHPLALNPNSVIAIGASTGGPALIANLLSVLRPGSFCYGVVAQHMVPDFLLSFCDWLQSMVRFPIRVAKNGERPEFGVIYIAPPNNHLKYSGGYWTLHSANATRAPHVPSIDLLFESLAKVPQKDLVGILLTGMGNDGAAGLKKLKEAGATTIVQEPSSAVVSSMPLAAIRQKAASNVLFPDEIEQLFRGQ